MPSPKQIKGAAGEEMAAKWLKKRGIRILERNYRYKRAEIDLIGFLSPSCPRRDQGSGTVIFIEVKWRRNAGFATPESAITLAKQRLLILAARAWLRNSGFLDAHCRFDAVILEGEGRNLSIRHIESAFMM